MQDKSVLKDDESKRDEAVEREDAAPKSAAISAPPVPVEPAPKKGGRKKLVFAVLALIALSVGGFYGFNWWTNGRFLVSTDDAYVQADVTTLVARASGYVRSIAVEDNTRVKAGDLLAQIDPADYRLAVQSARDRIAAEQATVARIEAQVPAAEAAVEQARAQLDAAEAARVRTQADFDRAQTLAARDFGSRQTLDAARGARDTAVANVESAKAGLAQAVANVGVTRAQKAEAEAALAQLQTALQSAERDLSFTEIRAPADGVIGNRAVDVGSYVTTGSRLMALVPTHTIYVAANFKETQLGEIVPGQSVDLTVDAIDDVVVKGRVESISPASGSVFSLLPTENATGNFTKITQRVPVRIAVEADDDLRQRLRPGLSVVVDVDTRTAPETASAAR